MKHALITVSIITGLLQNVFGQKRNGWLLYWHDKIIWLEDSIGKKVEDSAFFKSNASYFNGLGVSESVEANYYRTVANGKLIFYYNTSEVTRKNDGTLRLTLKARFGYSGEHWPKPLKQKTTAPPPSYPLQRLTD